LLSLGEGERRSSLDRLQTESEKKRKRIFHEGRKRERRSFPTASCLARGKHQKKKKRGRKIFSSFHHGGARHFSIWGGDIKKGRFFFSAYWKRKVLPSCGRMSRKRGGFFPRWRSLPPGGSQEKKRAYLSSREEPRPF